MGNPRIVRALWLVAALALVSAVSVEAHPLGNFSISQYTAIQIGEDAVALRYFIDMAEIPTFQELQAREIPADPVDARVAAYLWATAGALAQGLVLEVDGRRLPLEVKSADVIFPPGVADLPTMKLAGLMTAPLEKSRGTVQDLRYRDENFGARAGWKEVIATGRAGSAIVESSVPDRDRSRELSDYPTDLLDAPPQVREARVRFSRVPPPLAAAPMAPRAETAPERALISAALEAPVAARANAQSVSRGGFTDLIATRELTLSVVAVALAVAAALGAFHALEPGHGKTVVAAYLVGSRGTPLHALILGLIVTASHTAGVYLLGGITFYASQHVVPERLYPWVALGSGLTIAALGLSLFVRRLNGRADAHGHHHHHHHHGHHHHGGRDHGVHHHHGGLAHSHGPEGVTQRQLWALGITGGIVPCPAALVVLLSALSLRRVGFGLLLIVAFSVGLALVLVAIGMLMVYARRLVARLDESGPIVTRWLPLTSSAVMTLLGASIAVQALGSGLVPWKLT